MPRAEVSAYSGDRVVIGVGNASMRRKVFQINFTSKDGSIFVSVPYANLGAGRVGVIEYPQGNPESLEFGPSAPVTTHSVKYVHHPDGEAHFSQDGKVFTRIRRKAVPLMSAGGHLFTLMVQGLHLFAEFGPKDVGTKKRGVVELPLPDGPIGAVKFVGHLYSSADFARRLVSARMDSPLVPIQLPDGRRVAGVVLATKLKVRDQPYLLIVTAEEIERVAAHSELFASLAGGFDVPHIAFDHSRSTAFLMMLYPQEGNPAEIAKIVGSIDLVFPQASARRST